MKLPKEHMELLGYFCGLVALCTLIVMVVISIFMPYGSYEITVISKYQGDTGGATIRYLKTNKRTGEVTYCYLNTFDNILHNDNCSRNPTAQDLRRMDSRLKP